METGVVPEDWKVACIVLANRRKGGKRECANYRGISILTGAGHVRSWVAEWGNIL